MESGGEGHKSRSLGIFKISSLFFFEVRTSNNFSNFNMHRNFMRFCQIQSQEALSGAPDGVILAP